MSEEPKVQQKVSISDRVIQALAKVTVAVLVTAAAVASVGLLGLALRWAVGVFR